MESYEEALERINYLKQQDRLTYEEAEETLTFEDSYSRLWAIVNLRKKLFHHDWLKLLGEYWTCCDNIASARHVLKYLMGTTGPLPEMMDEAEQAAYAALPDTITVYRGCGPKNMVGASWTLDRAVAEKFPFLLRYYSKEPLLVTGRVKKKNVLAVKLDRDEHEIITFSARRTALETPSPPAEFVEFMAKFAA